jgi:tetratricopeptide (TPR) repeat protein
MKRCLLFIFVCVLFSVFSFTSLANDTITQADALFEKGDITNIASILESISLYIKAVEANPNSYEANWKCARAHREYADHALEGEHEGWEDICKEYGKKGMEYAEKAQELEPEKVEGHYYYGLSAGTYSDGVSILKALREGLKGSTQDAFYDAYEIDKMYDIGGPMLAIARFWHQLPFPFRNQRRSQRYFEEHYEYFPDDPEALVYYAELLIDRRKKSEAKPLLEKAIAGDEPFYSKWAERLLEDL